MSEPTRDDSIPRAIVVQNAPGIRRTLQSVANVETGVLRLSPRFLEALERVAPKKARSRLPLAIGLALITVITIFAADRSVRAFVIDRGREVATALAGHKVQAAPRPSEPAPLQTAVPAVAPEPTIVAEPPPPVAAAPAVTPVAAKAASKKVPGARTRPAQRANTHGGRG